MSDGAIEIGYNRSFHCPVGVNVCTDITSLGEGACTCQCTVI